MTTQCPAAAWGEPQTAERPAGRCGAALGARVAVQPERGQGQAGEERYPGQDGSSGAIGPGRREPGTRRVTLSRYCLRLRGLWSVLGRAGGVPRTGS